MEKLAGNVISEVLPDRPRRDVYLCSSESIESLLGQITTTSRHFGLLLALDARSIEADQIGQIAETLLVKDLAYLCAWGPDCERVHDIFDEVALSGNLEQNESVVLTTWHTDEPLEETLWFFVNSAFPDDEYEGTCNEWIIALIGHPEWEHIVRDEF